MKSSRRFAPRVEALDDRNLLSILLTNGLLDVIGTTGTDQIRITLLTPDQIGVTIDTTGESRAFDRSAVTSILVRSRAGDDFIVIGPNITQPAEVRAWAGDDRVLGGGGDDTLLGGGGDDVIDGRGGNDTIIGQDGNDFLLGNDGDDTIYGDYTSEKPTGGTDIIDGGGGNDKIFTGAGDDSAEGGAGRNSIDGVPDDGGGSGGGTGDDTFESNDTMQAAAALGDLTSPRTLDGLALLNDDWFKFNVPVAGVGGSVSVDFDSSLGDLDVELYNSAGLLVDLSEGVSGTETVYLGGRPADTYFVRVYGFDGATNPTYSMTLTPTDSSGGGGGADDQFEDNDTIDTATNLGTLTDATNLADLSLRDDDWYTFTTAGTGRAEDSISIFFQHALGDLDMELYDSGGNLINFANGVADSEVLSLDGLAAGAYFLRVLGFDGATNPVYSMAIVPPGADDSYEDNDTAAAASDLGQLTNDLTIDGLTLNDDDWYRFSIPTAGTTNDYVSLGFSHAQGDIDMQLFDAAGNLLRVSNSAGDGEFVPLEGLPAGAYLIRAYGFDGATNPTYSLMVAPPIGGGGSGGTDDTYEENDSFATATDLGAVADGSLTVTNLVMNDSADWYEFTTTANGDAGSGVQIFFENSQGDLDMQLFDAAGNFLNVSQGTSASESISLNGLPAGTYYAAVYGYQGATNPSYALTITPPTGGGGTTGGDSGNHVLYLSTEGYSMSHSELESISTGWSIDSVSQFDADGNGIAIQPFLANRADREQVITMLIAHLQADLAPFGVTVQRISGGPVAGHGATTLFMGHSTLTNDLYHVACDIDVGNDNPTDIAFVGDEDWGSAADTALALADVALHEAGHTFGLYHVQSGSDPETMGLRYNTTQDHWLADTSYTGNTYPIFPGHGPAGTQNSLQTITRDFGTAGTGNLLAQSPPGGLSEPAAAPLSSAEVWAELLEDRALYRSPADAAGDPQLLLDADTGNRTVTLHGANDPDLMKSVTIAKGPAVDAVTAKPPAGDTAPGSPHLFAAGGGDGVPLPDLDGARLTLTPKA
jgi:hypothetical protein